MHTRIKYHFDGPIGISKQSFRINEKDVRVMVHKDDFYFEIIDNEGNAVVKGGNTKNYAVLLRQAKRALVKMGYDFSSETRDRGGLSEKTEDKQS